MHRGFLARGEKMDVRQVPRISEDAPTGADAGRQVSRDPERKGGKWLTGARVDGCPSARSGGRCTQERGGEEKGASYMVRTGCHLCCGSITVGFHSLVPPSVDPGRVRFTTMRGGNVVSEVVAFENVLVRSTGR